MPTTFSDSLLQAMHGTVYNPGHDCLLSCPHVTVTRELFSVGLQEGADAIVIHLLAEGGYDVLVVGTPSPDALRRLKELCIHLHRTWARAAWPAQDAYWAAHKLAQYEAEARDVCASACG